MSTWMIARRAVLVFALAAPAPAPGSSSSLTLRLRFGGGGGGSACCLEISVPPIVMARARPPLMYWSMAPPAVNAGVALVDHVAAASIPKQFIDEKYRRQSTNARSLEHRRQSVADLDLGVDAVHGRVREERVVELAALVEYPAESGRRRAT